MAIVREPKPLPSPLDYVPPSSTEHIVSGQDSWFTLAERADVKAAKMSANDLCYFNFKTRHPSEINWYLYHKVGCRATTRDGKNYMFTTGLTPGVVYLPRVGPPPPVDEFPPTQTEERTNAWFGVGGKAGTMFAVVGIETLVGYVASLDDLGKGMAIGASINRLGVGVGATGGACFIFITGVSRPSQVNGFQQGDVDFNVSLAGNWGKLAQSAGKVKKLQPLIDAFATLGAKTPGAVKAALKAHPDKWVELIKTAKTMKDFIGINPNGEPNVFVFDIPYAGGGVEASVFYGVANFDAMWDFTD
jgi:hypothetical protein